MLIGLSLWTCWYFRFWWSLIGTPLGRDSCLPKPSLILRRPRSFTVPFATLPLPTASQSQSQSQVDMALRMHACLRRRRTQLDIFCRFQVMEWFHRNNCAIACDTRAQFWWGGAQRINKQNSVGNYLHGRWINSNFLSLFSEEPLAATFFSYARQPEVDFLHTWAVIWNKFEGKSSL